MAVTTIDVQGDVQYCPSCESPQPVEVPPCADGHGETCPDRACTACGCALVIVATHLTQWRYAA